MATQELPPSAASVKINSESVECKHFRSSSGERSTTTGSSSPAVSHRCGNEVNSHDLHPEPIRPGLQLGSDNEDDGEEDFIQMQLGGDDQKSCSDTPDSSRAMMCARSLHSIERSSSSTSHETRAWASSVLDELAQTQGEQGFVGKRHGLHPLTPTSLVRALGCSELLESAGDFHSRCTSSCATAPAPGLRASPPSSASRRQAVAAERCRQAVPELDMARVKMDYDDDEESADEESILRSCLKHGHTSLACGNQLNCAKNQRSEVPQLRMPSLAGSMASFGDPDGAFTPTASHKEDTMPSSPSRPVPVPPSGGSFSIQASALLRSKFASPMSRSTGSLATKWDAEGSLIPMDNHVRGGSLSRMLGQARLPPVSMSRSPAVPSGALGKSPKLFGSSSRCHSFSSLTLGKTTVLTHVHTHHHLHHHVALPNVNASCK